jgi:hypothetical protein
MFTSVDTNLHSFYEQIVAPVDIDGRKSCYTWNLLHREIYVLDPSLMHCTKSRIKETHEQNVVDITCYLCDCMNVFYPEWKIDKYNMRIKYINDVSRQCRWYVK